MQTKKMKNLGAKRAEMLAHIGIHTKDDLEQTGAVDTYLKLRKRGYKINLTTLYALESALLDIDINHLSNDIKQHLQAAIKAPRL